MKVTATITVLAGTRVAHKYVPQVSSHQALPET